MRAINIIAIAVLAFSAPVYYAAAQTHGESKGATTQQQAHQGSGTVNKVDTKGSKINITHGPIESLGWPGMTMDLPVKNAADLDKVKPGQSITFTLEKDARGRYVISEMKPAEK